jgi:quercetin 2,3-dioxygenase
MISVLYADERGFADHGWLKSYHTFSFADYHNPDLMGFRHLRVINEDWVEAGRGFGTHPHRDMEIITYVLEGALSHKDSMGNGSDIRPGDVQRMSAGTGVTHSEYNHSDKERVHLYQIWILPDKRGITPSYEQKRFTDEDKLNRLRLIAAPDGEDGAVSIHQDAKLYAAVIEPNVELPINIAPERYGWLQVARGRVDLNGKELVAGDAAAIHDEKDLKVTASERAEILLFDLS